MRICFFGDSFVNGTGDDEALGWVGLVIAARRKAGHDVTSYNLGIRRDTSADIARRWQGEALLRLPPDQPGRLVFSFGVNDCIIEETATSPRVAPTESLRLAREILAAANARWPTMMIGPPPIADPDTNRRIGVMDRQLQSACEGLEIPYLGIFDRLRADPVWMHEVAAGDGAHPNLGGYQRLAALVESFPAWRAWFA